MHIWDAIAPLILLYFILALSLPFLFKRLGQKTYLFGSALCFAYLIWALQLTPQVFENSGQGITSSFVWSSNLGLEVAFRLDPLAWLMLLIVNGVGGVILLYSHSYFKPDSPHQKRFLGVFLAFAASMSGLVLADHTMMVYLFWELTTLTSFLLIGHHSHLAKSRAAARQAILVTTTGSLAMFSGFVILGIMPAGSFRISTLLQNIPATLSADTTYNLPLLGSGLILVIIGAATKSALFPTHFWLPAAMAAPTPVSAFLHAAAMVKAGIYLLARLEPVFSLLPGFNLGLVLLGSLTLILGAYRSLRQTDLKLVLAFGTVSQLGLITVLICAGSPGAYLAGITLILAHATFKSGLFLATGSVEKVAKTRELTQLCGVGSRHKLLAILVALAAASMAGIPITGGYLAKETALHTLLEQLLDSDVSSTVSTMAIQGGTVSMVYGSSTFLFPLTCTIALFALTIGSILTVAYTLRYWWGAFCHKHDRKATCPRVKEPGSTAKSLIILPGLLGVISCLLGPLFHYQDGWITDLVTDGFSFYHLGVLSETASTIPLATSLSSLHLALWSGVLPFLLTLVIVAGGLVMFYFRPQIARFQRRLSPPPRLNAARIYEALLRRLERYAGKITGVVQTGSLPTDLCVIFTVTFIAGAAAIWSTDGARSIWEGTTKVSWADSWPQIAVCVGLIFCALRCVISRQRLHAVLLLSACGALVSLLFVLHGAPDLALTQLVVEAVSLVVFLLVLRRLPAFFSRRVSRLSQFYRLGLSIACGVGIMCLGIVSLQARKHDSVASLLPSEGAQFGGGNNLVNVILVDVRAWDTVGEISVLMVAATGVTALIYLRALSLRVNRSARKRQFRIRQDADRRRQSTKYLAHPQQVWLHNTSLVDPKVRSVVLEVAVRMLFHTFILVSIWLLLTGHNHPGGGFVGGLVAGVALILRYFAGGRWELLEAVPAKPGMIMGSGLFIAVFSALAPLFFGDSVLESTQWEIDLGWFGHTHFSSAMGLDIGVYVLVIGVVMDLLRALGSEIDRQGESGGQQAVEVGFDDRKQGRGRSKNQSFQANTSDLSTAAPTKGAYHLRPQTDRLAAANSKASASSPKDTTGTSRGISAQVASNTTTRPDPKADDSSQRGVKS